LFANMMRASIGDIVAAGAAPIVMSLLAESSGIEAEGHPPRAAATERARRLHQARFDDDRIDAARHGVRRPDRGRPDHH
jgi:hypothetical protein